MNPNDILALARDATRALRDGADRGAVDRAIRKVTKGRIADARGLLATAETQLSLQELAPTEAEREAPAPRGSELERARGEFEARVNPTGDRAAQLALKSAATAGVLGALGPGSAVRSVGARAIKGGAKLAAKGAVGAAKDIARLGLSIEGARRLGVLDALTGSR